jgi:2-(1,2-epoxy-1,2-dihydrophenyl)acetyl-CoA isomerase
VAEGTVHEESAGPLRVLTLSRPGKLNGMDEAMLEALADSVARAVRDADVRAILLTGEGDAFSAGGDPALLTGDDPPAVADRLTQVSTEVAGRIFHAEKPVVSAVDGPAIGAGFALALACDVVLASERARFGPVFTRRGILPDHAALWFLPRIVGLLTAKELVFSGRIVEAEEAEAIGLCTRLLPADGFGDAARSYADDLAHGPTLALGAAKVIMNKGLETDMWTVQTFERLLMPVMFRSQDFAEGFSAFKEKRPPRFTGR